MVVASGAGAVIPAYPLGPEGTAKLVPVETAQLLEDFMEQVGPNNTFLMGDSAGGNIALTAATLLRDRGVPLPARTILISPWFDLELKDAPSDTPGMNLERLHQDAEIWRGDLDFSDPLVSPLNAALHDLGKIALFCGTEDLVTPSCWQLGEAAAAQTGTDVVVYESLGVRHSHVLSDISAATEAQAIISDMILGRSYFF
jgi:acetyl esterase/lipase